MSCLYNSLEIMDTHNTLYIKTKWETELQQNISQGNFVLRCIGLPAPTVGENFNGKW